MKVSSFAEMGAVLGVKPEEKTPKTITKKCRKCEGKMVLVPGTNVFVCTGKTEDGKDCQNRVISNIRQDAQEVR